MGTAERGRTVRDWAVAIGAAIRLDERVELFATHPIYESRVRENHRTTQKFRDLPVALPDEHAPPGLDTGRTPEGQPGNYQSQFRVYGRDGKACPACGTTIRRLVVGQRGTHICPSCQRAPRPKPRNPYRPCPC